MHIKIIPFMLGITVSLGLGFLLISNTQPQETIVDTQQKANELEQIVTEHGVANSISDINVEQKPNAKIDALNEANKLEDTDEEITKEQEVKEPDIMDPERKAIADKIKEKILADHQALEVQEKLATEEALIAAAKKKAQEQEIEQKIKKTDTDALNRIEELKTTVAEDTKVKENIIVAKELKVHQENIDTFVYRLYGEFDEAQDQAASIEVLAWNDGIYGLTDHYTLQKFEAGDLSREYFIKPSFGTILPGINYYTIKVNREDGTTTEYIHDIVLESSRFDFVAVQTIEDDKSDPKTDQYAGQVKLRGYVETKRVPYCTAGWGFDLQECQKSGMVEYTNQYVFNIKGASDPRWYLFDNIQDHDQISLGCLADPGFVRRHANKYGPGLVSNIYSAEPSQELYIDVKKEYSLSFDDEGYCGITPELSYIING